MSYQLLPSLLVFNIHNDSLFILQYYAYVLNTLISISNNEAMYISQFF